MAQAAKAGKNEKDQSSPSGIKIITHGRYYYKTDTAKGTKPYQINVRVASLEMFREQSQKYLGTDDQGQPKFRVNSYLNIRGQLKRRLLPILLGRKFTDFARVRYVTIDEIISESGEKLNLPIDLRSREQLTALITEEKMPIDPDEYLEIDDLRQDITQYIQAPEVFIQAKPQKDRRRQEEKSFLAMNDMGDETLPPRKEEKPKVPKVQELQTTSTGGGVLDD